MSKLQTALAIPIALFALKAITKSVTDTETSSKLIPEGFTMGPAGTNMDIAPLFPTGKLELTTTIPGGAAKATGPTVPLGMGTDVVPDFGFVEGISTLDFSGLAGLKDLPKFDPGALPPGGIKFDLATLLQGMK
jgi:hypothetical protein